jgi:GTP-binding protein Era
MEFRAGFVAIIGRPNAGKSTLVNRLVGQKVAIVTPRPQTTRNRILGIANREGAQVVLIDTPGIHHPENALGRQMMEEVAQALDGIDAAALIVDAREAAEHGIGRGEEEALAAVERFDGPALLLLNKIDLLAKPRLLPLMDEYSRRHSFGAIVPVSALTGEGLGELLDEMTRLLPEGEPYFPPEQFTDQPERFLAAEIVREKAILATRKEVPYAIAVLVDSFEEGERLVRISATLYVEREGQKGILIGKAGEMLKRIGSQARRELEQIFATKVFLEMHVKAQPDWRDRPALVRQLDWRKQLEKLTGEQG